MPAFFILAAEYFIRHNRGLKEVRRSIREREKELRRQKKKLELAARAAYRANPGMYLRKSPTMPKPKSRRKRA